MSAPTTESPAIQAQSDPVQSAQTLLEQAAADGVVFPPSDLPSNEPPLESSLHLYQILLLLSCLNWFWKDRNDYFATGNLTVYYSQNQRKSEDFRGPDFFVVLGTERKPRRSWMVWEEEGKYPNIIIELLSDSTAKIDRGLKKQIYQDIFRTPDYFWFDPNSPEFQGFHLLDGHYHELQPNQQGHLWSQQLNLHLGIYDRQLRFFAPDGKLILTPEESAQRAEAMVEAERQRTEIERQRAETERQRSKRLFAKLQELGVDIQEIL